MTFKEVYDLVNEKKLVVVYTLVKHNVDFGMPQEMSDFTIHQDVICAAKMESNKYDILEEMGLPSTMTDIVLLDCKNNEIARGRANETHYGNVYLSIDEVIEKLRILLKRDADSWIDYIGDDF